VTSALGQALSGLVAYMAWYAVHVLGVQP